MRKMNVEATKNANGGRYHCEYCGWNTWGAGSMKTHQLSAHGLQVTKQKKGYRYHFHWTGKYNCYSGC